MVFVAEANIATNAPSATAAGWSREKNARKPSTSAACLPTLNTGTDPLGGSYLSTIDRLYKGGYLNFLPIGYSLIFARLNGIRIKNGGQLLGFLNPWIYQNSAAFNDVTQGVNNHNLPNGFTAIEGWDASSGVGTPNFAKMVKAL